MVPDGFADVEGLLVRRDAYAIGIVEPIRDLDPRLAVRGQI